MRKAVVLGAGGFVGAELLRLIATHPFVELSAAVSNSNAGCAVADVHPQLRSWTDLGFVGFEEWDPDDLREGAWIVFSALGHGETMRRLPPVMEQADTADVQIIDLSGDFRLRDQTQYQRFYGGEHACPEMLPRFIYGLTEVNRSLIRGASWVANPGCFATAVGLALAPAADAGWDVRCIAADGMTGSSGAGAQPSSSTHHPRRAHNIEAYAPLVHQHLPEISQTWRQVGGADSVPISFVPHRTPLVRGIAASVHFFVDSEIGVGEAVDRYRGYYADAEFVRVLERPPAVVEVWGSNRCDLGIYAIDGVVSVCSAIDNLVKGAAGQALQNANVMNGWDETAGLLSPMPTPI